jgi:SagB-type dehydrogenase family enzyme
MTKGIGHEFMQKTYYPKLDVSAQRQGLPQPPLQLAYDETAELIDLPAPDTLGITCDLTTAICDRRSVRQHSEAPLSLEALAFMLWCTQGVRDVIDQHATLRTVPSAGARHAFETYLLVNRVEGLAPGLYRYLAIEHKLLPIELGDLANLVAGAALDQTIVRTSAVTFIWTAVAERMMWRYGERGYRYMHLDAGHVCQNLYLAGEAAGAGVCAIAAFDDEKMNDILHIDGETQFTIYMATVARKAGA